MREQNSAFAEVTLRPDKDAALMSEVQMDLMVEFVDADWPCQLEAGGIPTMPVHWSTRTLRYASSPMNRLCLRSH